MAGVTIAAGSDMYYAAPGMTRRQASLQMLRAQQSRGIHRGGADYFDREHPGIGMNFMKDPT